MLRKYLESPFIYILSILFSVFVSINFFIRQQFFGAAGSTDLVLFFSSVPYISILVIPALCYQKNLSVYDNFIPLSPASKLFNRFFSLFLEYLILIFFLIPPVLCINFFGSIDPGQFFTGFLCLVFYGAASISLTLFLYELISFPVAAFLVSAVFLAVINSAHLAAVYISLNTFFTSLFKNLSFVWHFDAAGKGIIDSRDFVWFTAVTFIFILLNFIVSEIKKGKFFNPVLIRRYVSCFLILAFVMLNGQKYYFRLDLSECRNYSLSKYTKNLTSGINQSLKITYYRSSSLLKLYPQIRDITDFLMTYSDSSSNISLLIKDTDKDEDAVKLLNNYNINSQSVRTVKNTSTEYMQVYSAIIIEYNGNVESIPFLTSSQSLEYDLDGRINHLVYNRERTVNIILGNGMNLYSDFSYLVNWLTSQGFICNEISIEDPAFDSILDNTSGTLLVIGDSQIKIDHAIAIEDYILNKKGNAFFAVSPFSVNIEEDWSVSKNQQTDLVEMLENWGITFTDSICADVSCSRITMYSEDNQTQVLNYPLWVSLLPQEACKSGMTLFWPVILEYGENVVPLLTSSPSAYKITVPAVDTPFASSNTSSLIETNPFELQNRSLDGVSKQSFTLGAVILGDIKGYYNVGSLKDAKICVIPDSYFLSNLMTQYNGGEYGDYRNFDFLTGILLRLNGEEELAELNAKAFRDTTLFKPTNEAELIALKNLTFVILFIILPFVCIVISLYFIIREKKNAEK